jgi:hypothetical protein
MERRERIEYMGIGELYDEAKRIASETEPDSPAHYLALILKSLCRSVENLKDDVDALR